MRTRSVLVLLLLATGAGCSDVTKVPSDGGGGADGDEPQRALLSVSVVDRGVPIGGFDILVHGPAGELRGRYVSEAQPIRVQAEAGDSVGVVWQDPARSDTQIGWHFDSARVVEGMPALALSIETRLLDAPLNPPVRIEAIVAEPKGIAARSVWLPCDIGGFVPRGGSFVDNDFRGCPWSSESVVVATGYDSEGRLATFDHAVVVHDGSSTVSLEFPMTPVEVGQAAVDITWSSHVGVTFLHGGVWWSIDEGFYNEPEEIPLALSNPAPMTVPFPVLLSASAATHVSLSASWTDPQEPCGGTGRLLVTTNDDRSWMVDRLSRPTIDDDSEVWWLADQGDHGDAVVIDRRQRTSRMRWIEPSPSTSERFAIILPELPPDIADRFLPDDGDPDFEIYLEDRESTEGYATYVAEGAGERRLIDPGIPLIAGETRGRDICKGRY